MFLHRVEVKVATNPDMGLGLFAKEFIPKASIVWKFVEGVDIKLSTDQFNALNTAQREYFNKYGWIEKGEEDFYYSSCDLTNFMNHSYDPNVGSEGNGDLTIGGKANEVRSLDPYERSYDRTSHLLRYSITDSSISLFSLA